MAQTKDGAVKVAAQKIGMSADEYAAKIAAGHKWCYACKTWKLSSDFGADRSRGDGRKAKCFNCCDSRQNKLGPSTRERKIQKANGFSWCRGCVQWKDLSSVKSGLCRPCQSDYEREHYAQDAVYRENRRQRVHARKRGVDPIPQEGREHLIDQFDGRCAYCPQPAASWDHLVPISKGGKTTPGNVVPCCISCNSRKKDMELDEWLKKAADIHPAVEDRVIISNAGLYG